MYGQPVTQQLAANEVVLQEMASGRSQHSEARRLSQLQAKSISHEEKQAIQRRRTASIEQNMAAASAASRASAARSEVEAALARRRAAIESVQTPSAQIGSKWWAPHRDLAFVEATLEQVFTGERVRVQVKGGGSVECLFSDLLPRSVKDEVYPNMDLLEELNMAEVLANLDQLYGRQQGERPGSGWSKIYTTVGPVLIAMNPFQPLPCYGDEWVRSFRREGQAGRIGLAWKTLGPHCYGVVEQAFQGLRHQKLQCVVICGESGAGKTVTNRKMVEYLLDAQSFLSPGPAHVESHAAGKDQISKANAFLEYFGNAKTLRNDNSSRFGKLTQLHFKADNSVSSKGHMAFSGAVLGMDIKHYLLERSRVSWEPPGERTFHVFHHLLRSDKRTSFGLDGGAKDFRYTRLGADVESTFDDDQSFETLCTLLKGSGMSEGSQCPVFEALAAILHLGNVDFIEADEGAACVAAASGTALKAACELLGVDEDQLGGSLVRQELRVRGDVVHKQLNVVGSTALRDACAKIIYARVFDGLVEGVGNRLLPDGASAIEDARVIGLLDIFGFEDMPVNGLEQLFINLTNEQIQCIFNMVMFETERNIYEADGISDLVDFEIPLSNAECIALFMGGPTPSPCIIGLLGDVVKVNGQDGPSFVNRLNRELKGSPFFTVCEAQRMWEVNKARRERWGTSVEKLDFKECFQVRHYAGEVVYAVREFVSKSSDSLLPHMEAVLEASSKPFIRGLFQGRGAPTDRKAKSVGEKFREQLRELVKKLEGDDGGSSNLFVRCIKPNPGMRPGDVHRPMVLEQLICGGVVAALEIRRHGYPDRLEYSRFIEEFDILARRLSLRATKVDESKDLQQTPRKQVLELLEGVDRLAGLYACGNTRVFMRGGVLSDMRALQGFVQTVAARKVQRYARLRWGTQLIHTAETLKQELDAALADAQNAGVSDVDLVKRVAVEAQAVVEPIWSALENAKGKHGSGKGAIKGVVEDMLDHFKNVKASQKSVGKLRETAQGVIARRSRAEEVLSRRLGELKQEANGLALQVSELQRQLDKETSHASEDTELADTTEDIPSLKELQADYGAAKDQLQAFFRRLPELQAAGPEGLNLSCEVDYTEPPEGACPIAVQLLIEVRAAVEVLESKIQCLAVRHELWEQQTSSLRLQFDALRARLKKLQPEGIASAEQSMTGVSNAMAAAWQTEEDVDMLLLAARDEAALAETIATFQEQVVAAEAAAKAGNAFRRKRVRVEVQQLQAELAAVDTDGALRTTGAAFLEALKAVNRQLEGSQTQESTSISARMALMEELKDLEAKLDSVSLSQSSTGAKVGPLASAPNTHDPSPQTAEWMWGDLATADRWNPFRWSSLTGSQKMNMVIEQLKKCREKDLDRPVILKVPAGVLSPVQRFSCVQDALDALEGRGTATAWSHESSHRLPEDWEEHGGAYDILREAIVLKEEVSSSISLAVESLNEGIIRCDSDFCVVYSSSQKGYYLLFRLRAKAKLFDRLGLV